MISTLLRQFTAVFLTSIAATGLWAQDTRAVLVGVSDYLYLDADLEGPKNDVGLMARTLMLRGVQPAAMTVLSDPGADVPDGVVRATPDKATILAALEQAIATSANGDTLVFYFSGHGAQAPDTNGDEGGGLDEIFLPRDAKGWNGATGEVENAIRDDEFAVIAAVAAQKGVKLVAILDACHSGTGFRAIDGGDARARYISPAVLGLPDVDEAETAAAFETPEGEFVYLYAAQSNQRAFEYPVGAERVWHGDFTRALTSLMRDVPDMSYASMVQAAAARMQSKAGVAVQTPDVEGPLADAPVLGGNAPGIRRIKLDGQSLKAGLLNEITVGTEVAVYADLLDDTPAGHAVVQAVRANDADVRYLEPFPSVKVSFAEITNRALDADFSVAVTDEALALISSDLKDLSERVDVDVASLTPTHRIVRADDLLALVGRDGVIDGQGKGSSPRLGGGDVDVLARRLTQVAGRIRLERALAQLGQGSKPAGFSLPSSAPGAEFTLRSGIARDARRCARPDGAAVTLKTAAGASHCDTLSVMLSNPTAGMMDVTVLYIDAQSAVSMLWPTQNLSNRLDSGADKTLRFGLRHEGDGPIYESVIVLSVPAEPGSPRTRFSGLGTGAASRDTDATPIAAFLSDLTDPGTSRGFSLKPKGAAGLKVTRLDLTLTPDTSD